jgi:hypothetical protein
VQAVKQLSDLAQSSEGKEALRAGGKSVFQRFRPGRVTADSHGKQRWMTTIIPSPEDPELQRMGEVIRGEVLESLSKTLSLGEVGVSDGDQ